MRSLRERFDAKHSPDGSGCDVWRGYLTEGGYGQISRGARGEGLVRVHRLSYELNVGPIPDGLTIDHLCRNRACVKPEHLEAVPIGVNVLRGTGFSARNAKATHCIKGHPFDEENTYRDPAGKRHCRICRRAATAAWERRQREVSEIWDEWI